MEHHNQTFPESEMFIPNIYVSSPRLRVAYRVGFYDGSSSTQRQERIPAPFQTVIDERMAYEFGRDVGNTKRMAKMP